MRRRDFLVGSLSTAGLLATRRFARGQPISDRAAVVVGVNKINGLPTLKAAVSGAQDMGTWLASEGFDVKSFVDSEKPVLLSDLKPAVKELVNRPSLKQLVIYFAGHGFVNSFDSEIWLLSNAPDDQEAAISLTECKEWSRLFSIPSVVFISDACRSKPDDLGFGSIKGSVLFPKPNLAGQPGDVDKFLATRIGDSAFEISSPTPGGPAEGIYTACFLDAFKHPYASMVQDVGGKLVIPNRRLKAYLAREVPKRVLAASAALRQIPDAEICSDEPTFIGHVTSQDRLPEGTASATLSDVASLAIGAKVGGGNPETDASVRALATESGYTAATDSIVRARGLTLDLDAQTGFVVWGRRVKSVTLRSGIATDVKNSPEGESPSALVRVDVPPGSAASAALRFDDDTGTIVAALGDYVGNIVVDKTGVANVSYVPSRRSPLRSAYEHEGGKLEELRAAVAAAARFGVFRFEGPRSTREKSAEQLASRIRVFKGIDPTLGVYAAYAYSDAGLPSQVRSVRMYMHDGLGADLFDVVMLTGELGGKPLDGPSSPHGAYPFCPMLSQGWELLRVRDIRLPEVVAGLRDHLRRSLWITVAPGGLDPIEAALRAGKLS